VQWSQGDSNPETILKREAIFQAKTANKRHLPPRIVPRGDNCGGAADDPLRTRYQCGGSYSSFALAYAARGWLVLPVHSIVNRQCTCGTACGKEGGKHARKSVSVIEEYLKREFPELEIEFSWQDRCRSRLTSHGSPDSQVTWVRRLSKLAATALQLYIYCA
jgi:hypothetical protein